jgi:plastocyanin
MPGPFALPSEPTKKEDMSTRQPLRRRPIFGGMALLAAAGCTLALTATPPAQAQSSAAPPVVVGMKSLKFSPSKIAAKVNQQVDFKWNESVAHNIIFDKTRRSKTLAKKGLIWSTKFDKEGTFKFKCTLHPGMQGEVKVTK